MWNSPRLLLKSRTIDDKERRPNRKIFARACGRWLCAMFTGHTFCTELFLRAKMGWIQTTITSFIGNCRAPHESYLLSWYFGPCWQETERWCKHWGKVLQEKGQWESYSQMLIRGWWRHLTGSSYKQPWPFPWLIWIFKRENWRNWATLEKCTR